MKFCLFNFTSRFIVFFSFIFIFLTISTVEVLAETACTSRSYTDSGCTQLENTGLPSCRNPSESSMGCTFSGTTYVSYFDYSCETCSYGCTEGVGCDPAPTCTEGATRSCSDVNASNPCGTQTCSGGAWTGTCTGFPQWNECRGANESWACRTTTATSCTQTCSGTGCGCADGSYCQPPAPVCNSLTVQGTMANGGGTSNAYTAVSNVNFITNKTGDVTDQRFWRSTVSEPSGWLSPFNASYPFTIPWGVGSYTINERLAAINPTYTSTSGICSGSICYDNQAPTNNTPTVSPYRGTLGTVFTFSLPASDIGCATIANYGHYYRIDSTTAPGGTDATCSSNNGSCWNSNASVNVTGQNLIDWGKTEGSHTISSWARDKADNISSGQTSDSFCLDKTAPTVATPFTLSCSSLSGTASDTPACGQVSWVKYSVQRSNDGVVFGDYWNASTNGWGAGEVLNSANPPSNWAGNMPGSGYYYRVKVYTDDGLNTSSGVSQDIDCRTTPTPIPTTVPAPSCSSSTFSPATVAPGRGSTASLNFSGGVANYSCTFGANNWSVGSSVPPVPTTVPGVPVSPCSQAFTQTPFVQNVSNTSINLNGNSVTDSGGYSGNCPNPSFNQQGINISALPDPAGVTKGGSVDMVLSLNAGVNGWSGGEF